MTERIAPVGEFDIQRKSFYFHNETSEIVSDLLNSLLERPPDNNRTSMNNYTTLET
jgi:hypothetical protein